MFPQLFFVTSLLFYIYIQLVATIALLRLNEAKKIPISFTITQTPSSNYIAPYYIIILTNLDIKFG